MANVINASISYVPASPGLHAPVNVRVDYTVQFTPMERLLAAYGLWFSVHISFYDVDGAAGTTIDADDDFLLSATTHISSAQIVAAHPGNMLHLQFARTYDRPDLHGPNDDGSEFIERLRARVCVCPRPRNATEVTRGCGVTNYVVIDTHGPAFGNTPVPAPVP